MILEGVGVVPGRGMGVRWFLADSLKMSKEGTCVWLGVKSKLVLLCFQFTCSRFMVN